MGVKDLWTVLAPVSRKGTLYDLEGKTVAIDLSCWVCENQIAGEKCASVQPRMYLRNLFFRTSLLLMMNIKAVFVLEGEAPLLKVDTIAARNKARGKAGGGNGQRRRLKGFLNQCQKLIEMMGLTCVQGDGEAEATCAILDQQGLVNGVITQDSDAFLYGARTIYRNFNIQGNGGSYEVYRYEDIESSLHLTRAKLVALSLLCGCDYNTQGVVGVGKETAYRFLETLNGDVLFYLKEWRSNKDLVRWEQQQSSCSRCSHEGKARDHGKAGCAPCGSTRSCLEDTDPSSYRNLPEAHRKTVSAELSLRRKAIADPGFPNQNLIDEFLTPRTPPRPQTAWTRPNAARFVRFAEAMLSWEPEYSLDKVIPLCVRWNLVTPPHAAFRPVEIVKKRVVKGAPSFQVTWTTDDENIASLTALKAAADPITTVEPQQLIAKCFPDLAENFLAAKQKKVTKRPRKKDVDKIADAMTKLAIEERVEQHDLLDGSVEVADSETSVADDSDLSLIISEIISRKRFY